MKKSKELEMNLGDRMKSYEKSYEIEVKPEEHLCLRIDGHKFSKYTKGMKKPFDEIFSKAMELTTIDLVEEFQAYTGYTQSDEITLILPSLMSKDKHKGTNKPQWKHTSSGRVQKLASLVAGFTTMSFNKHFASSINEEYQSTRMDALHTEDHDLYEKEYKYIMEMHKKIGNAWFDCRVFGVPSDEEAFNTVMWRVRDAEKNSRSMFAQTYCSHRELQKLTGPEQVQFCKEKTGKDWELIDDRYKFGILVKKEQYEKEVTLTITGKLDEMKKALEEAPETVTRSRVVTYSEKLTFSDEAVNKIMRKYL